MLKEPQGEGLNRSFIFNHSHTITLASKSVCGVRTWNVTRPWPFPRKAAQSHCCSAARLNDSHISLFGLSQRFSGFCVFTGHVCAAASPETHTHTHTDTHIYTHTHTHSGWHTHTHWDTHTHTHAHTHTHTLTHAHTHAHTHSHTHTGTHTCVSHTLDCRAALHTHTVTTDRHITYTVSLDIYTHTHTHTHTLHTFHWHTHTHTCWSLRVTTSPGRTTANAARAWARPLFNTCRQTWRQRFVSIEL